MMKNELVIFVLHEANLQNCLEYPRAHFTDMQQDKLPGVCCEWFSAQQICTSQACQSCLLKEAWYVSRKGIETASVHVSQLVCLL